MSLGLILLIVIGIASFAVQWRFKNRFKTFSEMPLSSGLTGRDIAEKMLHDNGIYDVRVVSVEGTLSDHYNPGDYTVNLSPEVYQGRSIAAAAVAAHECGHAVQHAKAYNWLQLRTAVVPVVSFASRMTGWVLLIGIFMLSTTPWVLAIGVAALAITTLFSFITLPVEFDASRRALAWLDNNKGVMQSSTEYSGAKSALSWAAMTYVVAALSSLAMLVYYAMILLGGRRN